MKKNLNQERYHILKEKGTEISGTGKFLYNKKNGMYSCGACGKSLFPSKYKFDSNLINHKLYYKIINEI